MEKISIDDLPWRERQVVEVVYRLQEATAAQIQENLEDPPSNSAIRAMLSRLEEKGVLCHREEGQRYLYQAVQAKKTVADSALKKLVGVFYNDSPASAATALLGMSGKLSAQEIDQLQALIDNAKKDGR
jgi:predicted transcriptional regulator